MYIEVVVDRLGTMVMCYCVDTLPDTQGTPLFTVNPLPADHEHARVIVDTLQSIEIENACRQKAVIDPATQQPAIQPPTSRADYIRANFRVDMMQSIPHPLLPEGMVFRHMVRVK